jgi:hypothetical protein
MSPFTTALDLRDHRQIGKRLVAPWNKHSFPLTLSDWRLFRLPELVWIAELIASLGPRPSFAALRILLTVALARREKNDNVAASLATYWHLANEDCKQAALAELSANGLREQVSEGVCVLSKFYPEYPMAFLSQGLALDLIPHDSLDRFKARLMDLSDRFSLTAVQVHTHVVAAMAATGQLRFGEGMTVPNLDCVFNGDFNPDGNTEHGVVAGFVRATVGSIFAYSLPHSGVATARYFWNRGLELERCG